MCDKNLSPHYHCGSCSDCKTRDPERGTGRTQRLIVQSLCSMLMGGNVRHVMGNQQAVKEAVRYASEWLKVNGWLGQQVAPLTIESTNGIIRFGLGVIRFVTAEDCKRGTRPTLILEDHYAVDLRLEREAKAQRMSDCHLVTELLRKHGFTGVDLLATGGAHWTRSKE